MHGQEDRYPLSWPVSWPRTKAYQRKAAPFRSHGRPLSMADATDRLMGEVQRLGAGSAILSTNVELSIKGLPYSQAKQPDDPGAALYFKLSGQDRVLACDRWNRVEDNVAAIAQHIDALRRIDRYGVGTLYQAFAGYQKQLPGGESWWVVLGFEQPPTSWSTVENRHAELAVKHHPDRGGNAETMAKINAARDTARRELAA